MGLYLRICQFSEAVKERKGFVNLIHAKYQGGFLIKTSVMKF